MYKKKYLKISKILSDENEAVKQRIEELDEIMNKNAKIKNCN